MIMKDINSTTVTDNDLIESTSATGLHLKDSSRTSTTGSTGTTDIEMNHGNRHHHRPTSTSTPVISSESITSSTDEVSTTTAATTTAALIMMMNGSQDCRPTGSPSPSSIPVSVTAAAAAATADTSTNTNKDTATTTATSMISKRRFSSRRSHSFSASLRSEYSQSKTDSYKQPVESSSIISRRKSTRLELTSNNRDNRQGMSSLGGVNVGTTNSRDSNKHLFRYYKNSKLFGGGGQKKVCRKLQSRASIIVISLFIFALVACIGIALINVVATSNNNSNRTTVQRLAVETGQFFANELDKATLPLFSLAQFATELDIFNVLPSQIGQAGVVGSLPFINTTVNTANGSVRRNTTGVCDQTDVIEKFNKIAETSTMNARLGDVLHSIQLAPFGVLCLISPLIYTDPLDSNTFLNNMNAIGIDVLNTPQQQYLARETLKYESISIVGPRTLVQCPTCGLYFIVRIPIVSLTNQIQIDGQYYNRWGFATALIQWEKLIERSYIYDTFASQNKDFLLSRTDRVYNTTTNSYEENIVTLAQSKNFNVQRSTNNEIVHNLQTTNNEWQIVIQYADTNSWQGWAIVICFVVALCISCLVYVVLVQKQHHAKMKSETLVQEAKVDIERNMTAYFAHELRNPLCAIDCALLAMPDNLNVEMQELIHGMQLCSTFMSSIMNNLLDVRKMEEGKLIMRKEPFSLSKLVMNLHAMTLPTVKSNVELIPIAETVGRDWVLGDIHRLEQIMYNLISNSIKHTKAGSVTIYIGWDDTFRRDGNSSNGDDNSANVDDDDHHHQNYVRMECRDTGPGIPKDEQENLFERFTQRGGAPGSGLGLAIAKNLVTLMNGIIYFESDPTVRPGTTCVALLPLPVCEAPIDNENDPSIKELLLPIVEPIRILIVDDIKMNRTMLRRRFEKCIAPNGIIHEVSTGEDSLQICEGRDNTNQFDVIIMDHYMHDAGGVMVGTDAIIALRRMDVRSCIIGCSGNDLDESFFSAGANLIWKKPLPSNVEIIQQLRAALAPKLLKQNYNNFSTSLETNESSC